MAGEPVEEFHYEFERVTVNSTTPNETTDPCQSPRRPLNLLIPRQGSVEHDHYLKIWKGMSKYKTIYDLPYHLKAEVAECLDIIKSDRSDWRGVASHLGIKARVIENLEGKDQPCKKVFDEASNRQISELLIALNQLERHDVLNILYKHIDSEAMSVKEKREKYHSSRYPSQETTPESGGSMTSSEKFCCLEGLCKGGTPVSAESDKSIDSGRGSGRCRSSSNPQQHSDGRTHHVEGEHRSKLDFHSGTSKEAWASISPQGMSTRKEWKKFEAYMREKFPKQSQQSQLLRFICYVLGIGDYDNRHNKYISDKDFANMVAWFGPFEEGKDGCFAKMSQLIKGSVAYGTNTGSHSFFAGFMTKDEADKAVTAGENGTFLIRFSSTNAHLGSFVVVLKTSHGAEHHEIKQDFPPNGKVRFKGKPYEDLIKLYRDGLRRGGVSSDGRTSCTITCPDLPLNAMFKSYLSGPVPPSSMGRGRGRGRGGQQE